MATPIINDLVLPNNRILVLPDGETIGTIFRRSAQGGGKFKGSADPEIVSTHVLFVKENAAEVIVDGVEYLAMHQDNVVGLIPE